MPSIELIGCMDTSILTIQVQYYTNNKFKKKRLSYLIKTMFIICLCDDQKLVFLQYKRINGYLVYMISKLWHYTCT